MATSKKDERPKLKSSHGGAAPTAPKKAAVAKKKAKSVLPARAREAAAGRAAPRSVRNPEAAAEKKAPKSKRGAEDHSQSIASEDARRTAVAIAMAALDKKAVGIEILDVAGRVDYADFLVLMSGRSDRHTAALASGIEDALRKINLRPLSVEGLPHANWVLMDFGDVVVHVFQDDARSAYDLEGLWMDAQRLPLPAERGA